jgi:hypothetical protein
MTVAPSAIGADIEIGWAAPLENGSGCLTIGVHLSRHGAKTRNTQHRDRNDRKKLSRKTIGRKGERLRRSVNCSNPLIRNAALKANYPYMDLIDLYLAKRLQLAERVDARIMTEGDMQVALAQALVDITDQERQRSQIARENQLRDVAASAQLKAQQDAADAAKTNLYLNMLGQGLGMMSGR